MSIAVLLPLAVFFALGVPIVVLLWRIFVVGGRLRRGEQSYRDLLDLARRADLSVGELLAIVDDLRRGKTGPEESAASLSASIDALRRYAEEADTVAKNVPRSEAAGLRAEIDRARRAVELVEHGRQQMLVAGGRYVDEGETSVKRGYLNLMHAREAMRAFGDGMAATVAAGPTTRGRPRGGTQ